MKIELVGNAQPAAQSQSSSSPQQAPGMSARDRAIARLTGNAPASSPSGVNQSNASPEELGAIKAPSAPLDDFEAAKQKHSAEANASSESPAESETKEEPASSQLALLARKEKQIRQREAALKAREEAIRASEAPKQQASDKPTFDESKYVSRDKLKSDVFGTLTEMGFTYDELTEAALNGPKPRELELMNELKAMREELKSLKGQSETTKKSFEEYQEFNQKQGINQLTKQAEKLVANSADYETIRETGSVGDVIELIQETLKNDGVLLSVEEAAQEVENYLLEEALKLARIGKVQSRLAPKAAPAQEVSKSTDSAQQSSPTMKTLTNAVSTSRKLTPKERAILAFEGKLNK